MIGTAPALAAVADLVRGHDGKHELEDAGCWVRPAGPAQQRFVSHRLAVQRRPVADLAELLAADHPVGLPSDRVVRVPAATLIDWHCMSLRAAVLPGVPAWPAERVHLLSAGGWQVAGAVGEDGRWYDITVEAGTSFRHRSWIGDDDPDIWAAVVLRPVRRHAGRLQQPHPLDAERLWHRRRAADRRVLEPPAWVGAPTLTTLSRPVSGRDSAVGGASSIQQRRARKRCRPNLLEVPNTRPRRGAGSLTGRAATGPTPAGPTGPVPCRYRQPVALGTQAVDNRDRYRSPVPVGGSPVPVPGASSGDRVGERYR